MFYNFGKIIMTSLLLIFLGFLMAAFGWVLGQIPLEYYAIFTSNSTVKKTTRLFLSIITYFIAVLLVFGAINKILTN